MLRGLGLGALTSIAVVSVLFAGRSIARLPFAPFDVFEWTTRVLPGPVVAAGIDLMVSGITALGVGDTSVAAKAAEQTIAIAMFVLGSAAIGALVALARWRIPWRFLGLAAGAIWLAVILSSEFALHAITTAGTVWNAVVLFGWGLALAWSIARAASSVERGRRHFLGALAGGIAAASAALLGLGALFRRSRNESPSIGSARTTAGALGSPLPEVVAGRAPPAPGTRAELTPNERFYRIDIDLEPPRIEAAAWKLRVEGLIKAPLDLTLDQIRALPAIHRPITLACISNPVGGDLISTSRWTGVRLRDVLRLAGVSENARAVHIDAADGFYESVSIADANDERTFLVYEMNGAPLPTEHGFPLRIYIPNRYGMKQPKWITRLRVLEQEGHGYWVDRGWSKDAFVQTTSVIDPIASPKKAGEPPVLPLGGIAFAGARGVSKVEVQVDDAPWAEAKLIAPPLGALTWVLWRFDWPYAAGRHTFRVRAYDGAGAPQATRERGPHPDGATGLHTVTRRV